jgi:hypothetical protein
MAGEREGCAGGVSQACEGSQDAVWRVCLSTFAG